MAKSKKRTSKGAVVAIVISLITAAAFITGLLTDWFTNFNKYLPKRGGTDAITSADELYAPETGLLISQSSSDGIMLYSAATPLADFATYSLDENVEAVKTITARFTPADTTLQKVDYTATWKNAASSWATEKDVNDYITLTQSSDGSLDCAVSLLDAIGEQIIITCTARPLEEGDWVPSATCTVDYYHRATGYTAFFSGSTIDTESEDSDTISDYGVNLNSVIKYVDYYETTNISGQESSNNIQVLPEYSTGTILDAPNLAKTSITLKISDSIASKIKSAANVSTLSTYTIFAGSAQSQKSSGLKIKTAVNTILGGASNVESHRNALYSAFKEVYDNGQPAFTFTISYTTQSGNFNYTFTKDSVFNPTALGIKATELDVGPGIIF